MKVANIIQLFLSTLLFYSCGTDNLKKDKSIRLPGTFVVKLGINPQDSLLTKGTKLSVFFQIPDSVIDQNGLVFRNIVDAEYSVHPIASKIDIANNSAYLQSYNFEKGWEDKGRALIEVKKGVPNCEDTYTCRDTGVFWFSIVPAASTFRFWTADGKEYTIGATVTFDVPDMHTVMLTNYCPSLAPYLNVMLGDGFGHYCFKVVP